MIQKGEKVVLALLGSFNPPTIAHLRMLEVAKDCVTGFGANVVEGVVSPVADAYGKRGLALSVHRLEMVKRACETSTWIKPSEWECCKDEWTRTVLVLRHLKNEADKTYGKDVRVALVVGGDVVDSFTRFNPDGTSLWTDEDLQEIFTAFGLVVIKREDGNPAEVITSLQKKLGTLNYLTTEDLACPNAISSTRIRDSILREKSVRYVVTDPVLDYIQTSGLYK